MKQQPLAILILIVIIGFFLALGLLPLQPGSASAQDKAPLTKPKPSHVEAKASTEYPTAIPPDPAFVRYIDLEELAQAVANLDASALTDSALLLAEGERVLHRAHRTSITADDLLQKAAVVAAKRRDKSTLDRITRVAEKRGDKELLARLVETRKLAEASRAHDPGLMVSIDETSLENFILLKDLCRHIGLAELLNDPMELHAAELRIVIEKRLPPAQKQALQRHAKQVREGLAKKPSTVDIALAKLLAAGQDDEFFYPSETHSIAVDRDDTRHPSKAETEPEGHNGAVSHPRLHEISDPAFHQHVDLSDIAGSLEQLDAAGLTDVALQVMEAERVLHRPHRAGISSADLLRKAATIAQEQNDKATLNRIAQVAEKAGDKELLNQVRVAQKPAGKARGERSLPHQPAKPTDTDKALKNVSISSRGWDPFKNSGLEGGGWQHPPDPFKPIEGGKLLKGGFTGYKTDKFRRMADVQAGGWAVVWANDVSETDVGQGVVAAGVSVATENPEPFILWVEALVKRTIASLEADAEKKLPGYLMDKIKQLAADAIRNAIQGKSEGSVLRNFDTVDFKAGGIMYHGGNYLAGQLVTPTWGIKPYIALRWRGSSSGGGSGKTGGGATSGGGGSAQGGGGTGGGMGITHLHVINRSSNTVTVQYEGKTCGTVGPSSQRTFNTPPMFFLVPPASVSLSASGGGQKWGPIQVKGNHETYTWTLNPGNGGHPSSGGASGAQTRAIYARNNASFPISVAVYYHFQGQWRTEGFSKLEPGQNELLCRTDSPQIYFYASGPGSRVTWHGSDAFQNVQGKRYGFFRRNAGSGAGSFTESFSYKN